MLNMNPPSTTNTSPNANNTSPNSTVSTHKSCSTAIQSPANNGTFQPLLSNMPLFGNTANGNPLQAILMQMLMTLLQAILQQVKQDQGNSQTSNTTGTAGNTSAGNTTGTSNSNGTGTTGNNTGTPAPVAPAPVAPAPIAPAPIAPAPIAPAPIAPAPVAPAPIHVLEDKNENFNVFGNGQNNGMKLVSVSHETAALQKEFEARGGSLSFSADGTVSYKGMTNYYGTDRLVYTLEDTAGNRVNKTVDVNVDAIADAPTATQGAVYHPNAWAWQPGQNGHHDFGHQLKVSDLGKFDDAKDKLQQFSTYNANTSNDQDTLKSVLLTGIENPTTNRVYYKDQVLDFSNGKTYEIPVADIEAGKVVLGFNGAGNVNLLSWKFVDTGVINSGRGGENISNGVDGDGNTPTQTMITTPIALDMNADGKIGVTGATSSFDKDANVAMGRSVEFDMNADGKMDIVEWFDGSGDGILVDNRDGKAANNMNGSRLFGDQGGQFSNGFDKLRQLDANSDGKLVGFELSGLEMWFDDGDAVVEDGELQSLAQHDISSLSTDMNLVKGEDGKDLMRSTATKTNGQFVMTEDVWFVQK